MSPEIRVLKKLQKSLPNTLLCKKLLVVVPTEHILRGFMFSRGLPIKGRRFFEKVVTALYIPENPIYLSYSDRIPDEPFTVVAENIDEMSDHFLKIIIDGGHLDDLRNISKPKDFLEHMRGRGIDSRARTIDVALTQYMCGNVQDCIDILEREVATDDGLPPTPKIEGAMALLEDLKTNPANARHRIEKWERENIERLGLNDVMADGMPE